MSDDKIKQIAADAQANVKTADGYIAKLKALVTVGQTASTLTIGKAARKAQPRISVTKEVVSTNS